VREVKRRPLGISIIVVMQTLLAVGLLAGVATNTDILSTTPDQPLGTEARVLYVGWAMMNLLFAFWLWRVKRRGWVLTMVLTGLALTANLAQWWLGEPNFVRMSLQAVTAFYLNSAPVRELFLMRDQDADVVMLVDTEA
jgi:hypothetical protein